MGGYRAGPSCTCHSRQRDPPGLLAQRITHASGTHLPRGAPPCLCRWRSCSSCRPPPRSGRGRRRRRRCPRPAGRREGGSTQAFIKLKLERAAQACTKSRRCRRHAARRQALHGGARCTAHRRKDVHARPRVGPLVDVFNVACKAQRALEPSSSAQAGLAAACALHSTSLPPAAHLALQAPHSTRAIPRQLRQPPSAHRPWCRCTCWPRLRQPR